ncbi:MAG: hypothetical protein IJM36_00950, partial [Acholeplasmatales bacterium]|nr:hypothetical protein [Acholeplasmatales bacterium]
MKLRNKLILSCAALAAVATTAFSTTFAWYTANDTVKATGITGKTSENDATLLLISRTAKVGSWGASVKVDSSAVTLEPVAYDGGAYYPWVSNTNTVDTNAASGGLTASDDYISFYLYFKSGSSEDLTVKIASFDLVNTDAEDLPTFSVLAAGTGVTASTYSVNMFRALDVAITVEQGTEVASTGTSPVIQSGSRTVYNCDALASGDNVVVNSANAHTYYNNVKSLSGDDAIDDTKVASETTYTSIETLQSGDYQFTATTGAGNSGNLDSILMVRFDIYLDGWDKMCFDAVRKQAFTLDMEFAAVTD